MRSSYRLVRLIQSHADILAASLEKKVQRSGQFLHFRDVPAHDLRERVYEIYRHLGEWLLSKSDQEIEQRYREIGSRRAQQRVPLSELVRAIVLTKENLWEFLQGEARTNPATDVKGELELLQMLEVFFDQAIFYATMEYAVEIARVAPEMGALQAA
jgi:hypothetical protein